MSNRGSFVTEYIYCKTCFEAAKRVLIDTGPLVCSVAIPHWNPKIEGPELPIIAGKIGSSASGRSEFQEAYVPELARVICHPMRIAILEEAWSDEDQQAHTLIVQPIRAKATP